MILVPREAEGMTITPIQTLGGEETNEIHLDGVRVPEDALLGTDGRRLDPADGRPQLRAHDPRGHRARAGPAHLRRRARLRQGAPAVRPPGGQLPGALAPVRRAGHRDRPGAPAGALGRVADRRGPGRMLPQEASMAKLAATELAKRCALEGDADDGRLRLRDRVPDGALPALGRGRRRSTAARRRSRRTSSPRRSGSRDPRARGRAACLRPRSRQSSASSSSRQSRSTPASWRPNASTRTERWPRSRSLVASAAAAAGAVLAARAA